MPVLAAQGRGDGATRGFSAKVLRGAGKAGMVLKSGKCWPAPVWWCVRGQQPPASAVASTPAPTNGAPTHAEAAPANGAAAAETDPACPSLKGRLPLIVGRASQGNVPPRVTQGAISWRPYARE